MSGIFFSVLEAVAAVGTSLAPAEDTGLTEEVLRLWLDAGLLQQRMDDFFLTDTAAQQLGAGVAAPVLAGMVLVGKDGARILVPDYDEALRELRYGGRLVKRFRQGA